MRVAIAQIDPIVGDFAGNYKKLEQAYLSTDCDVLLTPELGVCGYPLHDLMDRPEMLARNQASVARLAKITNSKTALIVGHVGTSSHGRPANAVTVLVNGKQEFTQAKTLLPTYDVFDEVRYFEPAEEVRLWHYRGKKIALAICEDLWSDASDRHYEVDPIERYEKLAPDWVLSSSASPYERGKFKRRLEIHQAISRRLKCPLVYANQVGATDEILFDGGSFALADDGRVLGILPFFVEGSGGTDGQSWSGTASAEADDLAILHQALVTGIREYFSRTGFKQAIVGLSGGVDSALVAALAADAIGAKNVRGIAMPSQYSSSHSLADAEALAHNLGIPFEVRPIKFLYSQFLRELQEGTGELLPLAQENLQARIRGATLMGLSNHHRALVLATGNKSELATGYCTLYGDMVGGLAPIGDLYKTGVYELARFINREQTRIPESTLTKPPSAELKPDQKDQDTLPAYDYLDQLLEAYIEKRVPVPRLIELYGERAQEILRLLELSEYKRRQAAPILKVSSKAFGIGRRIPVAKKWDQE